MMKKRALTSIVPVLAVSLLWPAFTGAADPQSGSPSAGSAAQEAAPGTAANQPGAAGAAIPAPALPADWTKVKGTVQEVNLMDRQVKIQDEKGNLSQVTIDTDVTIRKGGKTVSMSQLQQGDKITFTRKKNAGEYNNKG